MRGASATRVEVTANIPLRWAHRFGEDERVSTDYRRKRAIKSVSDSAESERRDEPSRFDVDYFLTQLLFSRMNAPREACAKSKPNALERGEISTNYD